MQKQNAKNMWNFWFNNVKKQTSKLSTSVKFYLKRREFFLVEINPKFAVITLIKLHMLGQEESEIKAPILFYFAISKNIAWF